MKYQRFGSTLIVRMDRGEEVLEQLKAVCEQENVRLGSVSAIGATDDFTVGVFDTGTKVYKENRFTGAHEIVSLTGNVTAMNGAYYAHLHMCAANEAGNAVGGHLNRAVISATCEMFIHTVEGTVDRFRDEEAGLNLLAL